MSEAPLQDAILRQALELQRLSAGDEARALEIMTELERELTALLSTTNLDTAARREIEALLRDARNAIDARYSLIGGVVDTQGIMVVVAENTVRVLAENLPGATVHSVERLNSLAKDVIIDGAPASAWWSRQAQDTAWRFAREVRQGVIEGATPEQITARIVGRGDEPGILDAARRNVRALVHSSVMTAANRARLETFRKNAKHVGGVRWLATLDSHTCMTCAALDGSTWDLDGEPTGETSLAFQMPPAHFSCFAGDTPILARGAITGASKRWFDGEVVVFKTAAGRKLTCTPNHPILTDRGWVAAGLLDVGSNVVCEGGRDRFARVDGDGQNVPALIHEVAETVLAAAPMGAVPMIPTAPDFHGDGAGSEVAVVWSDSLLSDAVDAASDQLLDEFGFVRRGLAGLVAFSGGGGEAERVETLDVPARCGVCFADLSGPLLGRHDGPLQPLSLAVPPLGDGALAQDAGDNNALKAELLGDRVLRNAADVGLADRVLIDDCARPGWYATALQFAHDDAVRNPGLAANLSGIEAGLVELDAVVELKRIGFSHYVYNLETDNGWYLAQGVVSHNCRCVASPVPKSLNAILGVTGIDEAIQAGSRRASANGPVASRSFADFLENQPREFVEQVLGVRRTELYRQGKITLRDLVSGSGRELTLEQLKQRIGE